MSRNYAKLTWGNSHENELISRFLHTPYKPVGKAEGAVSSVYLCARPVGMSGWARSLSMEFPVTFPGAVLPLPTGGW